MIKIPRGLINPTEIAKLEWEAGVIPIDIKAKDENKPAKAVKQENEKSKK